MSIEGKLIKRFYFKTVFNLIFFCGTLKIFTLPEICARPNFQSNSRKGSDLHKYISASVSLWLCKWWDCWSEWPSDLLILCLNYDIFLSLCALQPLTSHNSDHLLESAMSHRVTNSSCFLWPWEYMEENIPESIPGGFDHNLGENIFWEYCRMTWPVSGVTLRSRWLQRAWLLLYRFLTQKNEQKRNQWNLGSFPCSISQEKYCHAINLASQYSNLKILQYGFPWDT